MPRSGDTNGGGTTSPIEDAEANRLSPLLTTVLGLCAGGWLVLGGWLLTTNDAPSSTVRPHPWLAHLLLFAALTITLFALLHRYGPGGRLLVLGLATAGAIATEVVQATVRSGRTGEVGDLAADLAGVVIAVVAGQLLFGRFPRSPVPGRLVAAASVLGLAAVAVTLISSDPGVQAWLDCRNIDETEGANGDAPLLVLQPEPADGEQFDPATKPLVLEDGRDPLCSIVASDAFTVIATIESANIDQDGPTRIVSSSISNRNNDVNFHLGQTGPHLSVRLRRGGNLGYDEVIVEDVINPGRQQVVALRVDAGLASVWIDGQPVAELRLTSPNFDNWHHRYPIVVGDEYNGGRRFEGAIRSVELRGAALSDDALSAMAGS